MPFNEDDLVMISALQHYLFCPRQCALIHVEQQWFENRYTAEGRILHERVHSSGKESRTSCKIEFDLPLRSLELGLVGRGDIVEFHKMDESPTLWQPFPVEYKRGRPKKDKSDQVQLCAQAICLEEMLGVKVPEGALYYGQKRKRSSVLFTDELRILTKNAANDLHAMIEERVTPAPIYNKRCDTCSFVEMCLPKVFSKVKSIDNYLRTFEKP